MDLILRDRLTGEPLSVLPASPLSGFLSVEVTERLWRPDMVTVELDARVARRESVIKGRLLEVQGLVFLVEQVHASTDDQSRVSALATVTGYDPISVPRSMQPAAGQSHDVFSGRGESAMKHYLSRNIGPGAGAQRRWPALAVEPDQERGRSGSWRARYVQLVDMLELIGMETGVGYRTVWDPSPVDGFGFGRATFTAVVGSVRDRLLSVDEGTARREEILTTDSDRVTKTYVGGQGEGTSRVVVERHSGVTEPAELSRREEFVDARDTDSTDALASRGDARLAETQQPDAAELEVAEFDGWRYGVDFDLGDTVHHRSEFLAEPRMVRVVQVVTVFRESHTAPTRTVALDRPFPDVTDREAISGGTQFE